MRRQWPSVGTNKSLERDLNETHRNGFCFGERHFSFKVKIRSNPSFANIDFLLDVPTLALRWTPDVPFMRNDDNDGAAIYIRILIEVFVRHVKYSQ